MPKSPIVVKRYKSEKEYQRDAIRMNRQGYQVDNVVSEQPRSGCLRILSLGLIAAIFKPKPVLVVTYKLVA